MRSKFIFTGAAAALLLQASVASATSFSYTGTFSADDNVQLFNFSVSTTSDVSLISYSYGGGTQADGNVVSAGGFDTILTLFDSAGNLITFNDDGGSGGISVNTDPTTGQAYDSGLLTTLTAGDYTVAVTEYNNFANANTLTNGTLADGFQRDGQGNFTGPAYGCSNGQFCDVTGSNRTNFWAFDVLGVDTATAVPSVPVPAAAWLFGSGLIGLLGVARRKTRS